MRRLVVEPPALMELSSEFRINARWQVPCCGWSRAGRAPRWSRAGPRRPSSPRPHPRSTWRPAALHVGHLGQETDTIGLLGGRRTFLLSSPGDRSTAPATASGAVVDVVDLMEDHQGDHGGAHLLGDDGEGLLVQARESSTGEQDPRQGRPMRPAGPTRAVRGWPAVARSDGYGRSWQPSRPVWPAGARHTWTCPNPMWMSRSTRPAALPGCPPRAGRHWCRCRPGPAPATRRP